MIKKLCSECGSDRVMFDAWAEWDAEDGQFVLAQTFDDCYCEECESTCTTVEVKQ